MIRTKGEAGTGNVVEAVRHMRTLMREIRRIHTLREDELHLSGRSGAEWAIEPYVGFILSEFLRFRLAYKHTDRSRRFGSAEIIRSETSFDEVLFQASFVLGAHPRRPY